MGSDEFSKCSKKSAKKKKKQSSSQPNGIPFLPVSSHMDWIFEATQPVTFGSFEWNKKHETTVENTVEQDTSSYENSAQKTSICSSESAEKKETRVSESRPSCKTVAHDETTEVFHGSLSNQLALGTETQEENFDSGIPKNCNETSLNITPEDSPVEKSSRCISDRILDKSPIQDTQADKSPIHDTQADKSPIHDTQADKSLCVQDTQADMFSPFASNDSAIGTCVDNELLDLSVSGQRLRDQTTPVQCRDAAQYLVINSPHCVTPVDLTICKNKPLETFSHQNGPSADASPQRLSGEVLSPAKERTPVASTTRVLPDSFPVEQPCRLQSRCVTPGDLSHVEPSTPNSFISVEKDLSTSKDSETIALEIRASPSASKTVETRSSSDSRRRSLRQRKSPRNNNSKEKTNGNKEIQNPKKNPKRSLFDKSTSESPEDISGSLEELRSPNTSCDEALKDKETECHSSFPKAPLSAYHRFTKSYFEKYKEDCRPSRELFRAASKQYRALSNAEKEIYFNEYLKDKEKYKLDVKKFVESHPKGQGHLYRKKRKQLCLMSQCGNLQEIISGEQLYINKKTQAYMMKNEKASPNAVMVKYREKWEKKLDSCDKIGYILMARKLNGESTVPADMPSLMRVIEKEEALLSDVLSIAPEEKNVELERPPKNGYQLFVKENLKDNKGKGSRTRLAEIAKMWRGMLSEDERNAFNLRAQQGVDDYNEKIGKPNHKNSKTADTNEVTENSDNRKRKLQLKTPNNAKKRKLESVVEKLHAKEQQSENETSCVKKKRNK